MPSVFFIKEATRRSGQLLLQHPVCFHHLYLRGRIVYAPFPAFDAFLASKTEPPQKRPAPAQPANIQSAKKKGTKWCSACHQDGHIKSNCPKHKADQQATRAEGAQLIVDSLMAIPLNNLKAEVAELKGALTKAAAL
ncbi:hypothetical protein NW752_000376 [Fusarium irregulare]|uniref:CCHC-type domain-containing protein n=1 Tax=Fusarium irregulare TaxID=2494466 RepID=A0A9W8PYA9_9HYPO|nr:hypothetical protein NW766_001454 [Fusarium irregulare]KAJ4028119.1 hypothetical protein NW752_000376 [Fusarium irregulare]